MLRDQAVRADMGIARQGDRKLSRYESMKCLHDIFCAVLQHLAAQPDRVVYVASVARCKGAAQAASW